MKKASINQQSKPEVDTNFISPLAKFNPWTGISLDSGEKSLCATVEPLELWVDWWEPTLFASSEIYVLFFYKTSCNRYQVIN